MIHITPILTYAQPTYPIPNGNNSIHNPWDNNKTRAVCQQNGHQKLDELVYIRGGHPTRCQYCKVYYGQHLTDVIIRFSVQKNDQTITQHQYMHRSINLRHIHIYDHPLTILVKHKLHITIWKKSKFGTEDDQSSV